MAGINLKNVFSLPHEIFDLNTLAGSLELANSALPVACRIGRLEQADRGLKQMPIRPERTIRGRSLRRMVHSKNLVKFAPRHFSILLLL
jgi:hypothetical protein